MHVCPRFFKSSMRNLEDFLFKWLNGGEIFELFRTFSESTLWFHNDRKQAWQISSVDSLDVSKLLPTWHNFYCQCRFRATSKFRRLSGIVKNSIKKISTFILYEGFPVTASAEFYNSDHELSKGLVTDFLLPELRILGGWGELIIGVHQP